MNTILLSKGIAKALQDGELVMSRTFVILSTDNFLRNDYVSPNVEYRLINIRDTVYFCRNTAEVSCTYMNTSRFKRALREGIIVFTD